jgi:hypothetical protein
MAGAGTTQGEHICKHHARENPSEPHHYLRHTCGHEFCGYHWIVCPRCYGSGLENVYQVPALAFRAVPLAGA